MPEILEKQDKTLDLASDTMITMLLKKFREVFKERGVSRNFFND